MSRSPPRLLLLMWPAGSAWAMWLAAHDIDRLAGLHIGSKVLIGRDFANMWSGGRLALAGRLDILYDFHAYRDFQSALFGSFGQHAYSYPPTSLLVAAPLALLPYVPALILWLAASAALFAFAARPFVRSVPGLAPWAALITPAATINLWAGQYGLLFGALWLLAFSALERRRDWSGGALVALLSIKPHLAALVPLILVARGRWRAVLAATLGVALLATAAGLAFGFELWPQFFARTSAMQAALMAQHAGFFRHMMPTAWPLLQMLGLSGPLAWAGQALFAAAAAALVGLALAGRASMADMAFIAATATFVLLPYAFNYDMTVAVLGMAVMLYRQWAGLHVVERAVLMLGFAVPQAVMVMNAHLAPLAPLILLAVLAVQVRAALAFARLNRGRAGRADAAEARSI